MLYAFYKSDKGSTVQAMLFLGGKHKDGGLHFVVVPEAEVEAAAADFASISSKHIYSLQNSISKVGLAGGPAPRCAPPLPCSRQCPFSSRPAAGPFGNAVRGRL